MEQLTKNDKLTSLEISEITGKPHYDVMKAIRKMEEAWLKVNGGNFSLVDYVDGKGEKRPCYQLTKTESLYIATKFNDEARAKLILRWEQLEKQALNPYANLNKLDALRLAVESEERNQLLEQQIKIQAPKVAYVDKVLDSKSVYVTNQIAKELGTSAISLNRMLNKAKVIYKQNDTWLLYAKYQSQNLTKTKTYTYTDSTGAQKTSMQLVWLEKGRQFIHELFNNNLKVA